MATETNIFCNNFKSIQKPQNYVYETNFYILTKNINYIMFLYVTILSNPKYNSKYTPDTVTARLFLSIILYYTEMLGQKASDIWQFRLVQSMTKLSVWHFCLMSSYDFIIKISSALG